jgi:hypothetical protein
VPGVKENNTGKSTLGNLLRLMLGANVAIVGNQDLAGDFNATGQQNVWWSVMKQRLTNSMWLRK